jgi:pilus assembly protein CpaF
VLCMSEIFRFEQHGLGENREVIGEIQPTGVRPRFLEKLKISGVKVPSGLFARDESPGRRA